MKRQMTEAELRSLFKEKKHEVPMMQKNLAQAGTMHLETMKQIAKDKGWSTERDATPRSSPVPSRTSSPIYAASRSSSPTFSTPEGDSSSALRKSEERQFYENPKNTLKIANYIKNDTETSLTVDQIAAEINALRDQGKLGTDAAPTYYRSKPLRRAAHAYAELEGRPKGERPTDNEALNDYRLRNQSDHARRKKYEELNNSTDHKESLKYLRNRLNEEAKFKLPPDKYKELLDKADNRDFNKFPYKKFKDSSEYSNLIKDPATLRLIHENEKRDIEEGERKKKARINTSPTRPLKALFPGANIAENVMNDINALRDNPQIAEQRRSAVNSPAEHRTPISATPSMPRANTTGRPRLNLAGYSRTKDPRPEADDLDDIYSDKPIQKSYQMDSSKLSPVGDSFLNTNGPKFHQDAGKMVLEKGIDQANKPYTEFRGDRIVPFTDEEENARLMIHSENPFTNEVIQDQEQEVMDRLKKIQNSKKSSEAAHPYLNEMIKNPTRFHNEHMGPMEQELLNDMETRSNRNFKEKILPELTRKYLVPGMVRSGGMNRTVRDAMEQHGRSLREDLNKAQVGNRLATTSMGQNYAKLHGDAGKMASENASSDIGQEMKSTDMLQAAHNQQRSLRRQGAADQERIGGNKRDWQQRVLNEEHAKFLEKRDHEANELAKLAAIHKGLPVTSQSQALVAQLRADPRIGKSSALQTLGTSTAALGASVLPQQQQYKKGGVIKKKNKYADGGSVMAQANENAVIDREDPLTALRKLMNRQRMMDVYETKIGKRRYREGGQVNPIMAGAEQARQFMGEKDLRAHIESKKTPRRLGGVDMVDIFMKAAAADGDANALSRTARGYTVGADARNKKIQDNEERQSLAFKDLYGLDTNSKKELAALRSEEREEKKMLADDKYRNAALAQTGAYHKGRLDIEREKLGASDSDVEYGDIAVRKQTKDEKAAVKKANEMLRAARLHKRALAKTKGIEDVPTGPTNEALIKNVPYGFGYSVVSGKEKAKDFFGIGSGKSKDLSGEKIKDMEDRSKEALQSGIALEKALTSTGGRWTNMSHGAMESSKISTGSSPESNVEKRMSGEYSIEQVALESARMKINAGIDPTVVEKELQEFGLSLKDLDPSESPGGSAPTQPAGNVGANTKSPSSDPELDAMKAKRAEIAAKLGM